MGTTDLSALGADFEVILADRLGVILAESGAPNPDACQALADLVRDVAREIVESMRPMAPGTIPPRAFLEADDAFKVATICGNAKKARSAAVRLAALALRLATEDRAGPRSLAALANGGGQV